MGGVRGRVSQVWGSDIQSVQGEGRERSHRCLLSYLARLAVVGRGAEHRVGHASRRFGGGGYVFGVGVVIIGG